MMTRISRAARLWAVKELARRAGVSKDFFESWQIENSRDSTTIRLLPGTRKQITFRRVADDKFRDGLAGRRFRTVRARWMACPREPIRSSVGDLVVPYCERQPERAPPLFSRAGADSITCFADLPAATLLMLARAEERQDPTLDAHSRFTAASSIASRDGFLERPVVDEWGLAFGQAIEALLPGWQPKARSLRATISHDVDEVGLPPRLWRIQREASLRPWVRTGWMLLPFDVRHAIQLTVKHHAPLAGSAHFLRALVLSVPTCLELVQAVVNAALHRGLHSAVYWKASRLGPFDSGYDPRQPKIRELIDWLREREVENGVHPGYGTFRCPEELRREVEILRNVIGEEHLGGRQHYLRWCPESWVDWESCGLIYDSTVGYADRVGFRAGTCIPYRPWLLSHDREAQLLEIPLIVMDVTLLESMELRGQELLNVVRRLIEKCRAVGGVFTFLCHNTTLRDANFVQSYENILDMLAPSDRFDCRSALCNEWS
jgi:hypothetical protein